MHSGCLERKGRKGGRERERERERKRSWPLCVVLKTTLKFNEGGKFL